MLESKTESAIRSDDPHRATLEHLAEAISSGRPLTVSIDGLPPFDVRNEAAKQRLAETLERVIETEITQMSLDAGTAGEADPVEEFDAEFRADHGIPR